jgi:hypothetical protein
VGCQDSYLLALTNYSPGEKREPVDDLLDALVWMRRNAKKHEPVDARIDARENETPGKKEDI